MTILEIIMTIIESAAFFYYGYSKNGLLSLIFGFIITIVLNLVLLFLYYFLYRPLEEFQLSKEVNGCQLNTVLVFSFLVNNRFFKFLYSNIGHRPYFSLN